jgi:dynein heavy chain
MRNAQQIHPVEWKLFVRGAGIFDASALPSNPNPDRIPQASWEALYVMESTMHFKEKQESKEEEKEEEEEEETIALPDPMEHALSVPDPVEGICNSLITSWDSWQPWITSETPYNEPLPSPYNQSVNSFQKLILIKLLCDHKLLSSISLFVEENMGKNLSTIPSSSIEEIYADLTCKTPCIFILSTGADPTNMLLRFAREMEYSDRIHIVSLGQGQGPTATKLFKNGMKTGDWVLLQNCMLAKSWMPDLEQLVFELQESKEAVHPDFRLFLTSSPVSYFPVSVLQGGVKMTNEPPKGLRANVMRSFANLVKEELYEGCERKRAEFKKLLVGLAFFHANVQERRKFGPLGWNIQYAFDESDLDTSISVMKRFLEEQDEIPWDALRFVTGEINYGGRVTDDWDRRTLMSILGKFLNEQILDDAYKFSPSGTYKAPVEGPLGDTIRYFESLPGVDGPEIFGMHNNAVVSFNRSESQIMMSTLLSLQPRDTGGGSGGEAKTSDEIVTDMAISIEESLPDYLSDDEAGPTTFVIQDNGLLSSLATVLKQEMVKFNRLLRVVKTSLADIQRAIKGFIVMSSDLDSMYSSFLQNQVPEIWKNVSFESLKSLGSWVKDFIDRLAFLRSWVKEGEPTAFPLPVFFFPQGFMTGTLQTYARKHMEAVDTLKFEFKVLDVDSPDEIQEGPDDGVYIYGLFLEGAGWDKEKKEIRESYPSEMYCPLPLIHFNPRVDYTPPAGMYECPVYKTTVRKGVLSTTGLSTNFVIAIDLPTSEEPDKWVLSGVAALCSLTD